MCMYCLGCAVLLYLVVCLTYLASSFLLISHLKTCTSQYATVHRLETNKLRNVAKFFAQLYYSDALPWTGMYCIHLNEEETNSSRYSVQCMCTYTAVVEMCMYLD